MRSPIFNLGFPDQEAIEITYCWRYFHEFLHFIIYSATHQQNTPLGAMDLHLYE
jgi:hypothetical protein